MMPLKLDTYGAAPPGKPKRFLAFVIDMAIVLILAQVCYSFLGAPDYPSVSRAMQEQKEARGTAGEQTAMSLVLSAFGDAYLYTLLIYFAYELLSAAVFNGATAGKRICGLRVVPYKECGLPVRVVRLVARPLVKTVFIYVFNGIPFIISALTLFTNSEGRAGADFLAGTKVVTAK